MGSEAHSERCQIINKTNNMNNGNLNPRQQKFIDGLFQGLSNAKAYEEAGYKANGATASAAANQLLKNIKVRHEIRERVESNRYRIESLADKALGVYVQILCDEGADLALRHRVASDILDRAGFKPELIQRLVGDEKQPIRVLFEGLDE